MYGPRDLPVIAGQGRLDGDDFFMRHQPLRCRAQIALQIDLSARAFE